MKSSRNLLLLGLFLAWSPVTVRALVCAPEDEPQGVAKILAAAVDKIGTHTFDPKFCQAFRACAEMEKVTELEEGLAIMEAYFANLESALKNSKASLDALKKSLETLQATEPKDYLKISNHLLQIKGAEKALQELEADQKIYQAYLADPTKPHPAKQRIGYDLSVAEKKKLAAEKLEVEYQERSKIKEEYYQGLEQAIDLQKKVIEQVTAQKINHWSLQTNKDQLSDFEKDLVAYKAHLADPVLVPHPMRALGLGLGLKEREEKRKVANEAAYKFNEARIPSLEEEYDAMLKKIKDLKEAKVAGEEDESEYYEEIADQTKTNLDDAKAKDLKYQAYLKDPKSQPDFLLTFDYESGATDDKSQRKDCSYAKELHKAAANTLTFHKSGSCGTTPEEMALISYYAGSGYGCLNGYLRQTKFKSADLDFLVTTLNSGLSKIPSFKGLVKRGASLPENIRELHKTGVIVTYDAYTSSSTADGFSDKDSFFIYSETGKPIMGFSGHDDEAEVLFKAGAKFKVLETRDMDSNRFYVLKDVSAGEGSNVKEEDEKILSLIHASKPDPVEDGKETKQFSTYYCPIDESATVPASINQDVFPKIFYPEVTP